MLNYITADLVVSCQQGDDLLSSSSLQQLLEESRQVISGSRPHSSVVNSSGTTDPLYSHKCQTPQHHQHQQQQPTTPTYKVEFHDSEHLNIFPLLSSLVFTGCGGLTGVNSSAEVVWVCLDETASFFPSYRPVKLHPKSARDTSQTCGRPDFGWSTDSFFFLLLTGNFSIYQSF